MVTKLSQDIYWVGIVDWGLKRFHGYELSTHRGSTYNAYLIMDEKVALVDTVWDPFAPEFLDNVRQVIDPAKIDYIVANHAEPDHSGSLPAILRLCPNATVVVSKRGAQSFPGHYHAKWNFKAVGSGERLRLGKHELLFLETPMLHWPDTMFTYIVDEQILMPNDAFGQHYATAYRFNDQVNTQELYHEALKYYANTLPPFSDRVTKKIEEFQKLNLPVRMIAPSHGVIWRQDPLQIVTKYAEWAKQVPEPRACVLYSTMWQATRRMAEAIAEGLQEKGVQYTLRHMAIADHNDVVTEAFTAKALVVGCPTHNGGLLPSIAPVLEDIRTLKLKNKVGAAFGSYGWSGESVKLIEENFAAAGIPLAAPGVRAKWQPATDDLAACRELGRQVGAAVLAG